MTQKPHSQYWMDEELYDDEDVTEDGISFARITRLAATRRAVANFVNILTGRNDIIVRYSSGKESYTDGKQVIISADDNPDHFDSLVGLALHEGSHILLSDFTYLESLHDVERQLGGYGWDTSWASRVDVRGINDPHTSVLKFLFHPAIAAQLPTPNLNIVEDALRYKTVAAEHLKNVRVLMNILEDRRIDRWVYRSAGGYRPYYNALYERYFFTGEMGKNLKWNPEWREMTIENYINRLLFCFHPDASPEALPGLKELIGLMDLANIDRVAPGSTAWLSSFHYMDQPRLWQDANLIYAYILRFAALAEQTKQQKGQPAQIPEGMLSQILEATNGLPNLDPMDMEPQDVEGPELTKGGKEKPRNFNDKRGKSQIQKAKEVLTGNVKKKKAKKQEIEQAAALEQANAKMVDLKGDGIPGGQCMVTRRLTESMLQQNWFIFASLWGGRDTTMARVRNAGRRMGQVLVHRLQVRNDPVTTKNTRLPQGGLDRRLLAQLGMEITSVFQKSRVDTYKPAMLHLTLDASGSMSGRKWEKVMTIATALAYVGTKMRNIDTVITLRGGNDLPMVCVVFDSRKDQFTSWSKWMMKLQPAGSTPEGLCFKATMELILECAPTHDVYFINFSDGEPMFHLDTRPIGTKRKRGSYHWEGFCNYGGEVAERHTRAQVQNMREHGVKVLSYYINDHSWQKQEHDRSWAAFKRMYGQDAAYVNVENATEVIRTLNKLLLAKV